MSDKYLSNIENARSIPSVDVLSRICNALNTTPNSILLGTINEGNSQLVDNTTELLKLLDENQILLVNNFIKWLAEQDM